MTLKEMKHKVLALIEEYSPDSAFLTEDPDIQAKLHAVINQVLFELARFKKIPAFAEIPVQAGDVLDFETIAEAVGYDLYQIDTVQGVRCSFRAGGTVLQILESGVAQIDCFVYPEPITEKTKDSYEFALSRDALEIMPWGVAGDLLKSDVSGNYGSVYAQRYQEQLARLEHRYRLGSFRIEGGVSI